VATIDRPVVAAARAWTPPARWRYAVGQHHVSMHPECRVLIGEHERRQDGPKADAGPPPSFAHAAHYIVLEDCIAPVAPSRLASAELGDITAPRRCPFW
jgi:hypothetical protein